MHVSAVSASAAATGDASAGGSSSTPHTFIELVIELHPSGIPGSPEHQPDKEPLREHSGTGAAGEEKNQLKVCHFSVAHALALLASLTLSEKHALLRACDAHSKLKGITDIHNEGKPKVKTVLSDAAGARGAVNALEMFGIGKGDVSKRRVSKGSRKGASGGAGGKKKKLTKEEKAAEKARKAAEKAAEKARKAAEKEALIQEKRAAAQACTATGAGYKKTGMFKSNCKNCAMEKKYH